MANVDSYASQLGWYNLFKPKGKGNKYLGLDALVGVRFLPHTHTPFRFEFWWYVSSICYEIAYLHEAPTHPQMYWAEC